MKNGLSIVCGTFILVCFTNSLFASPVYLFNEPQPNAKIIGKLELRNGMVPIFKPAGSDWMKVADPQYKHTGWININDIEANGSTIIYNQEFSKQTQAAAVNKIYQSAYIQNQVNENQNEQPITKHLKNPNPKSDTHLQTFSQYIHSFIQTTIQEIVKSYNEINKQQPKNHITTSEQSINKNF